MKKANPGARPTRTDMRQYPSMPSQRSTQCSGPGTFKRATRKTCPHSTSKHAREFEMIIKTAPRSVRRDSFLALIPLSITYMHVYMYVRHIPRAQTVNVGHLNSQSERKEQSRPIPRPTRSRCSLKAPNHICTCCCCKVW
jgi:hypothetical protein